MEAKTTPTPLDRRELEKIKKFDKEKKSAIIDEKIIKK
jgi:hypothetical protein